MIKKLLLAAVLAVSLAGAGVLYHPQGLVEDCEHCPVPPPPPECPPDC